MDRPRPRLATCRAGVAATEKTRTGATPGTARTRRPERTQPQPSRPLCSAISG